jgi:hypothetical protein
MAMKLNREDLIRFIKPCIELVKLISVHPNAESVGTFVRSLTRHVSRPDFKHSAFLASTPKHEEFVAVAPSGRKGLLRVVDYPFWNGETDHTGKRQFGTSFSMNPMICGTRVTLYPFSGRTP